jgi:hypothetical protein
LVIPWALVYLRGVKFRMAAPEVAAALVSVAGSVFVAGAMEGSRRYWNWRRSRGRVVSSLRTHPLFKMHEDIKLEICTLDAVRSDLLNHVKDEVLLRPVQEEVGTLLANWTDASIYRVPRGSVCEKLSAALESILRAHAQESAQMLSIHVLVQRMLHPFSSNTVPSINELIRSEYDACTLLTLTVNILYTSLFALIVDWNNCANMLNGSLNNVTWKGSKLQSSHDGSRNSFVAQIKRWSRFLLESAPEYTVLVLDADGDVAFANGAPLPGNDPIYRTTGASWEALVAPAGSIIPGPSPRGESLNATLAAAAELQILHESMDNALRSRTEYKGQVPLRATNADGSLVALYECCADHVLTKHLPEVDGDKPAVQRWCTLMLLRPSPPSQHNQGHADSLADVITGAALLMRLAVLKYDSVVSVSEIETDIVRYRTETSPTKPLVVINVPLHINLGISHWEIEAAVERTCRHQDGDLLRFTTLSYVSKGVVYKAHIYRFNDLLFALHVPHPSLLASPPSDGKGTFSFLPFGRGSNQ